MIRVISGLVMALGVILGILYLPAYALKLVVAGLSALCLFECARMLLPRHPTSSIGFTVLLGTALCLAVMFSGRQFDVLIVAVPLTLILSLLFYLFRQHSVELAAQQVAMSFFTAVYAGGLFAFLGLLRDLTSGSGWLMTVLASTFAADTGAYIAGHLIGRHKLAPRISPGKTVEGLFGGVALSITAAFISKYIFFKAATYYDCLAIGTIAGFLGPLGDLSESMLKRAVGVKDSSNLIPGHGGLLDRVDALLFTSPLVYYYAAYLRNAA